MDDPHATERQLTSGSTNHVLANANVWSHDCEWIYYDVRSDAAGERFDGARIERVNVASGAREVIFESVRQACVGVPTASPVSDRVVFIHGPEDPTDDWNYCAWHRRGVIVNASQPGRSINVDARDLVPPFTPGALRGGSHVHTFSPDGKWIAFTYEDHVLAEFAGTQSHELNQRQIGVSVPAEELSIEAVSVSDSHVRNHHGNFFSVLVSLTHDHPRRGSDEISRAFEDAWVGADGYLRSDGVRQRRAIAFQGEVCGTNGQTHNEVFLVDLPDRLNGCLGPGVNNEPIEGTRTNRPRPPRGVVQRRLTRTEHREFPGIQGPRHWLRSSPDGTRIAFLMKDHAGVVQLWTVSPSDGSLRQLTTNAFDIASAFTWSPDGRWIAHAMDTTVCVTDASTGETLRVTSRCPDHVAPRAEACVFSPDGNQIAYVRRVSNQEGSDASQPMNQIFVLRLRR